MSQAGIANGEDNLVMRWARAWSTQDVPLFLSLFADDARYCDVALDKVFDGREAIRAFFEGTFATFPDFKMKIGRSAVTADAAAGEWICPVLFWESRLASRRPESRFGSRAAASSGSSTG
jgi:uncharacterized protein (TIGR02246 family)